MILDSFFDNFEQLADSPSNIHKLRNLILELAVRGKLFEQAPSEESGKFLRDSFKSKKAVQSRLSSASDNKEDKRSVNFQSKVSDYVKVLNGYAFKSSWFTSSGIRLVRNANVSHGILSWKETARISEERADDFQKFKLDKDDIVISLDRPIISTGLKVARISSSDLPCLLLQRVGKIDIKDDKVLPEFFYLWLKSPVFINAIDPGRSNGVPHISAKQIEALPFSPPEPEEQKRIVAKVDYLMALCDRLERQQQQRRESCIQINQAAIHQLLTAKDTPSFDTHWQRIANNFDLLYNLPENVTQLRQAILQLAVQGKLVKKMETDSSVSQLLSEIHDERSSLIASGKVKKTAKSKQLELPEQLFSIPSHWKWVRLSDVCHVITDGEHLTPQYCDEGIPMLSAKNIGKSELIIEDFKTVSPDVAQKCWSRCKPEERDILVVSRGGGIGRTIVSRNTNYCLMGSVLLFKPSSLVDENFIWCFLNSSIGQEKLCSTSGSSAQQAIYISHLKRNFVLPLAPREEQKRIVAKVERLMALCDCLENQLTQAQANSEKLMEAAVRQVLTS